MRGLWCVLALAIALGFAGQWMISNSGDLLAGFSGDRSLTYWEMQAAITGFCLSPLPAQLMAKTEFKDIDDLGDVHNFEEEGHVDEEDYTKDSIYAIFYSLYQMIGETPSPVGPPYNFTFNTWGISNVSWIEGESEPQRHGKAAYQGLVEFPEVKAYVKANLKVQIVEIGSGTGAGADHITKLLPESRYLALDMQQAAIDTCNKLHAKNNPQLTCQLVPGGVGGSQNGSVPLSDNSVDIVIISETHIAEVAIGPEELAIFREIVRILKPGGMFVWGNALPTSVWRVAPSHLMELGFEGCGSLNHTQGGVQARIEDKVRNEMVMRHMISHFPVLFVPYIGDRCQKVCWNLVMNFFRYPGTAMFNKMKTGADSYMHLCHRIRK